MYFPSKFGCYRDEPKQKTRFEAKKKKGKQVKKMPKPFKKKKFFKRKNKKGAAKPTSKQIQRQHCRCWNCNEKVHFTTVCPKQLNFIGTYSDELFDQLAGYEEVSYPDIDLEDEIAAVSYTHLTLPTKRIV